MLTKMWLVVVQKDFSTVPNGAWKIEVYYWEPKSLRIRRFQLNNGLEWWWCWIAILGTSSNCGEGQNSLVENVTTTKTHSKQDEAHEPECRHVCWQTETISICRISSKLTCETTWVHTLRWHSCKTLSLDLLVRHSSLTLLFDTLVRHSYLTLLWDTLIWHSYLTLL